LGGKTCQHLSGDKIDTAVAHAFLEAMQPAQLDVSMATLSHLEAQAKKIDHQWRLRLERAQYEADLAKRRFLAVEPENRLVARTLETDWNDKLTACQQLKREYDTRPRPALSLISPQERQRILDLARDLPTLWQAKTTTHADKKQLIRFLIKDVTLTGKAHTIHIGLRWQTGALTEREIPRPKRVYEAKRTDPEVVDRVRQLAPGHTDRNIADRLNKAGFLSGTGTGFTEQKVHWIRYAYGIPTGCPKAPGQCPSGQRGDGCYSARAAAELLNVDVSTIAAWCRTGRLDGCQDRANGPHWIKLTPQIIAQCKKPVRQRWTRPLTK